jgi:hypothetical protein
MAIRFGEDEVRPMGLVSAGVLGMKLKGNDLCVGMETLPKPGDVLLVASDGSAKRVTVDQFPRQGRYGQGVAAWKLTGKALVVGMAIGVDSAHLTLFTDRLAPKLVQFDEAPLQGRPARGKILPALKGCRVTGFSAVWPMEEKTPGTGKRSRVKPARSEAVKHAAEKPGEKETVAEATQLSMNNMLREVNGKTKPRKAATPAKPPAKTSRVKKTEPDSPTPKKPRKPTSQAKARLAGSWTKITEPDTAPRKSPRKTGVDTEKPAPPRARKNQPTTTKTTEKSAPATTTKASRVKSSKTANQKAGREKSPKPALPKTGRTKKPKPAAAKPRTKSLVKKPLDKTKG